MPHSRRVMSVAILLAAFASLHPQAVDACGSYWRPIGPDGGEVRALAVDPTNPSTVYDVIPEPIVVAVDPMSATTVYAGTSQSGLYKSTDGGGDWTPASVGLPENAGVQVLAIDPVSPATLYAAAMPPQYSLTRGLFKSTNGGTSWAAANVGIENIEVTALAIDPNLPATLYAGSLESVFKSTDAGAAWSVAGNGLPRAIVKALAIDPMTSQKVYAATNAGVFRTSDGGGTWRPLNTGLTLGLGSPLNLTALAILPDVPSVLYLGTESNGVLTIVQDTGCPGDCNGTGSITVDEIVRGLTIALGTSSIVQCPSFDESGDGSVSIDEVISVVISALNGCPSGQY